MNILITGANGQLGSEFKALYGFYPHFNFIFTDVGELDITDFTRLNDFFRDKAPDVVINCAAFTAVDLAEDEPERAMQLNRDAVANLAEICGLYDSFLVHISTDYVFDGNATRPYNENDIPCPASVYGLTKVDGEYSMQSCLQKGLIIRTSWLYSSFGNNFVKTILNKCKSGGELNVVFDQVGSPTYARDLAVTILTILPAAMTNSQIEILHYSNTGQCSWYEFAQEILTKAPGTACKIKPVKSEEYPVKAKRPPYSVLDTSKVREKYGLSIPDWRASLQECIRQLALTI